MSQTTTTMHENTVRVGETDIHYVERGEGKPIVLIHGFAPISTWRVWEANMATLAQDRAARARQTSAFGSEPMRR